MSRQVVRKINISLAFISKLSVCFYLVKPTNNGELCKLPYRMDSNDWDMYFCNRGYCPTESNSKSQCEPGSLNAQ